MAGPFPPVPNVVQVRVQGTTPNELWENVLYVQYSGTAPTAANLSAYALLIQQAWNNNMAAECPSRIIHTNCTVTDLSSNTGAQGVSNTSIPGTRGDDLIPANAAVLISYPVSARWRGGHFRQYLLAGGNADNQDGMSWHAAFVTEVQNHWNNFFLGFIGNTQGGTTFTQHVGVRRHGKYLPNAGPPHYVLDNPIVIPIAPNSAVAHAQIASQKGRIGRRSK